MLAEKRNEKDSIRQRQRLKAFTETEVWKQDIKPLLIEKLTAAKSGIFYSDEEPIHWKSIGIYAHIEEMLEFIEEVRLEKILWEKRSENKEQKPKRSLKNWLRNKRKTKW